VSAFVALNRFLDHGVPTINNPNRPSCRRISFRRVLRACQTDYIEHLIQEANGFCTLRTDSHWGETNGCERNNAL
jgi:hypothetical protein